MNQAALTSTMEEIIALQSSFLASKSKGVRKAFGQFFTGTAVSDYMASLIQNPNNPIVRILDAGAGTGILTVSTALQCLSLGCLNVHAVLYEIDGEAIPSLKRTLNVIKNTFRHHKGSFSFEIRCEDFVIARPDKDSSIESFDVSVINPPYFKYNVNKSPYAKAASDLYRGDPNIYASFLAIVLACMKEGGQMISITPRSFTNGLYFRGLRSYLLNQSALDLIHIFKRRDKLFKNKDSAVLQENIICRFIKGKTQKEITIRSSDCATSVNIAEEKKHPFKLIIDLSNEQQIIRVPESAHEASILNQAENLSSTFEKSGYFISTGPIVEHRTQNYITKDTKFPKSIPLYRPHNVTPLTTSWTGVHKKDTAFILNKGHEKHTLKNNNFVLLKRFSSKDEKRRLVSGVYLKKAHDCEFIGFGNKINYIGIKGEKLTKVEAYGLAAVFQSSFMDKYFRCISGNTQVNATEVRVMKFPTREQIKEIGRKVQKFKQLETAKIDLILNRLLPEIDNAHQGEKLEIRRPTTN